MKPGIKQEIRSLLKKYWSHDDFRPLQEDIILSVLNKHDTLALLPTGGGKSICFQVPGLALGGTTLVVSPLIALMNDQVDNLKKRGISAVAISASMNFKEIDIALENAAAGHVQFLYVSPERLQNETFRQKLSYLPITLIAVDEAHCISQWGYDFRPSYLKIADLRAFFPGINIVALTASATGIVAADICTRLSFTSHNIIRQSFARKNLRYIVQEEENKGARLLKLITNVGGSGVVYVRNRRKTEQLAEFLRKNKIGSLAYHAGLKFDERQKIQDSWISNKIQVICATNAFGMGIDKPDVRFVAHMDLPDSVEAYFQEAGRGGRDGKTAYCVIFASNADRKQLTDNFEQAYPEQDFIRHCYKALCNYHQLAVGAGEGLNIELDIDRICRSYNLPASRFYNSLKFLEKENYLSLIEGGSEPSRLMMIAGKKELYDFELKFPGFESLIKTLLRSYGGLFGNYVHISEKDLAYRIKTSAAKITDQLIQLDKQKLISYVPQTELPRLVFMQNRVDDRFVRFDPENYQKLKETHYKRICAISDYTLNNKLCRQIQLLMYFNEHEFSECGYCDVCLGKKYRSLDKAKSSITKVLGEKPLPLSQIRESMKRYNDETWVKAFNELLDDGIVSEKGSVYGLREE